MASIFMPKAGMVQAWMMPSGSEVTYRRTILLTGTTTGTSVDSSQVSFGLELVLGLQIGGEGDLRRAVLIECRDRDIRRSSSTTDCR